MTIGYLLMCVLSMEIVIIFLCASGSDDGESAFGLWILMHLAIGILWAFFMCIYEVGGIK